MINCLQHDLEVWLPLTCGQWLQPTLNTLSGSVRNGFGQLLCLIGFICDIMCSLILQHELCKQRGQAAEPVDYAPLFFHWILLNYDDHQPPPETLRRSALQFTHPYSLEKCNISVIFGLAPRIIPFA